MSELLGAALVSLAVAWAVASVAARVLPARRLRRSLARFPEVISSPGRLVHVADQTPFAAVDLLYSIALFELDSGHLSVSLPAHDDWWSLQVLTEDADNAAYRSGTGGEGGPRFVLRRPGDDGAVPEGHDVVDAPVRGVVVLRWLVRDEAERSRVDELRRAATITRVDRDTH